MKIKLKVYNVHKVYKVSSIYDWTIYDLRMNLLIYDLQLFVDKDRKRKNKIENPQSHNLIENCISSNRNSLNVLRASFLLC